MARQRNSQNIIKNIRSFKFRYNISSKIQTFFIDTLFYLESLLITLVKCDPIIVWEYKEESA